MSLEKRCKITYFFLIGMYEYMYFYVALLKKIALFIIGGIG